MQTAKTDGLGKAQADLSLRLAHMPFCWFCHALAFMVYVKVSSIAYFRNLCKKVPRICLVDLSLNRHPFDFTLGQSNCTVIINLQSWNKMIKENIL